MESNNKNLYIFILVFSYQIIKLLRNNKFNNNICI